MSYQTPRSVALDLDMELRSLAREMVRALTENPVDDQTQLAIRREMRGQRDSAARLRALFPDTSRAA